MRLTSSPHDHIILTIARQEDIMKKARRPQAPKVRNWEAKAVRDPSVHSVQRLNVTEPKLDASQSIAIEILILDNKRLTSRQ